MRVGTLLLAATLLIGASAPAAHAQGRIGDVALLAQISNILLRSSSFSIFDDVNVSVNDRAVTLTGRVTMPFKREELGKRIAQIDGVRSLTNDIQVLPASKLDGELRPRVAQAIYSHPAFWHYASMINPPIHIVIEHGHVTLTGCVNNEVERRLAFALAQVDGVLDVKNLLRLDK